MMFSSPFGRKYHGRFVVATVLALQPHFAEVDQDELEKDAEDDLEAGMRNIVGMAQPSLFRKQERPSKNRRA